jgi:flagellar biosynthesis/type III secretory pathway M-ring protein FliF/YscJ
VDTWRRRQAEHERRIEWRRQFLWDALVWGTLSVVAIAVAWAMWRMDGRSERLFNVVATERACVCPGAK